MTTDQDIKIGGDCKHGTPVAMLRCLECDNEHLNELLRVKASELSALQRRLNSIKQEAQGYKDDHLKCVHWCCENGLGESTDNATDEVLKQLSALQKENDKLRLRLEIFESSDHADGVVALCNTSVDLEYERDSLRTQNRELRSALESLKHADGCYCESAFSGPDGSHPRHSDECVKARQALALQPEK